MSITLRDYQQPFYDDIWNELFVKNVKRVCGVLPTGGGKSVVIGKLANNLPGRTLILTHRVEIFNQNSEWVKDLGMLASDVNTLRYDNKVVIAMVQTLDARLKNYGDDYIGSFDNIILDEVHILIFEKVFNKYNYDRLIGFTGSPVVYGKKIETSIDNVDYVEDYTLSQIFDTIVCGPSTQELIDLGYLVQDYNIVLRLPDFDKLKESDSNPDGYTSKSMNEVYYNTVSLDKLMEGYYRYAKDKKTLIFNSSNKVNKMIYDHMKSKGINCKMFDTSKNRNINPETGKYYKRSEIIEWFRNEKDAVLINTNVFTTGFDVDDVECIIMNRATKSLALFIQIIGRGSRITNKTFKDKFTVLDLGQNIYEHGLWSQERDWEKYFYSNGPRLKNNLDMLSVWECEYCGYYNVKGTTECGDCGAEKLNAVINGKDKKFKDGQFTIIKDMDPPRGRAIVAYCKKNNLSISEAIKITQNRILELFVSYRVSESFYARRKEDYVDKHGFNKKGFDSRVKEIFRPCYFAILDKKSGLTGNRKRKLNTENERLIKIIEKNMNYDKQQ